MLKQPKFKHHNKSKSNKLKPHKTTKKRLTTSTRNHITSSNSKHSIINIYTSTTHNNNNNNQVIQQPHHQRRFATFRQPSAFHGGGTPLTRLEPIQIKRLMTEIPTWVKSSHTPRDQIQKRYKFNDNIQVHSFLLQVGQLANQMKHYPEFFCSGNNVDMVLWTPSVQGLSVNDIAFAARCDYLSVDVKHTHITKYTDILYISDRLI